MTLRLYPAGVACLPGEASLTLLEPDRHFSISFIALLAGPGSMLSAVNLYSRQ
jgi:hypothetical protein